MPAFKFEGITIEEAPKSAVPKCPKCEKRLDKIWVKMKGTGIIEQKQNRHQDAPRHPPMPRGA